MPLGTLLALVAPAWAHLPHDNVVAVAAPAALDTSYPWLLVYGSDGEYLLSRSDDAGASWYFIGGDPVADVILGGTQLTDGTSVLLAETRYWWTTDAGDTWTSATLPGSVEALTSTGTTLLLGGADGVYSGSVGGTFTQELTSAVEGFGAGPSAWSDTTVYHRSGSSWSDYGSPATDISTTVHAGSSTFAGTDSGLVYKRNGTTGAWSACASLPTPSTAGSGHEHVIKLVVESGTLLAFPAWRGPYRSSTTCSSWSDRSGPPDTTWGNNGGATSESMAWTFTAASSGTWAVAGWGGLWTTPDSGSTWYDRQTIPPDYTRDIVFSPDFENDHRIWFAGYSGGPTSTTDGGLTFSGANHGLAQTNVQRYSLPRTASDSSTVYVFVNHTPRVSYDSGETWSEFAADVGDVSALAVWDTGDEVWAFAGSGIDVPLATEDGGDTWTELTDLGETMDDSRLVMLDRFADHSGDAVHCAIGNAPARFACSWDGGSTWDLWFEDSAVEVRTELAAWPVEAATRYMFLADDGLHYTDDEGVNWTTVVPNPNDEALELWVAPTGTVFVATATGWILSSSDGGETWDDPGLRLTTVPQDLIGRPDFATYDELLISTFDGTWRVLDAEGATPTLERWPDYQRIEDDGAYFRCDDCVEITDFSASHDSIRALSSGITASLTLRGDRFSIRGDSDGTGQVEVEIDGVSYGTFGSEVVATGGTLFSVDGLPYGVHQVELIGQGTDGVRVDGVDASGPYDTMEFAGPDADGDGQDAVAWGGDDCDDGDATVYLGATETWYDGIDQDCDGANDYDQDGDGFDGGEGDLDCDDLDPAVFPGAVETWYDDVDQDCGGDSDFDQDGDDQDADSWGGLDCDDLDPAIAFGAVEIPGDGIDQNCDGSDLAVADFDGDGQPSISDGGTDCDDTDATVYWGAAEVWYDGIDQDCDYASDFDQDGDGTEDADFGGTDCDDTDPAIKVGATETWYDGVDQNCDGRNDYDRDGDSYPHRLYGGTDCNDANPAVRPNATETWYDGVDQNCDGRSDYDKDGDGYLSSAYGGTDCDDNRPQVRPGATEVTGNAADENCNGSLLN